jgi:minor fimbrial subunit
MPITFKSAPIISIFLSAYLHPALAESVTVNVTGNVIASPCTVDTGSVSQDVNFGQQIATKLNVVGTASDWQSFQVKLVNCPASTRKATVTFNGIAFATDTTLYSNAGTATGVAIQMAQDNDKNQIQGNGSSMTVDVDATLHTATYALAGRLISPSHNSGAGTVNSIVQMSFTYQ